MFDILYPFRLLSLNYTGQFMICVNYLRALLLACFKIILVPNELDCLGSIIETIVAISIVQVIVCLGIKNHKPIASIHYVVSTHDVYLLGLYKTASLQFRPIRPRQLYFVLVVCCWVYLYASVARIYII